MAKKGLRKIGSSERVSCRLLWMISYLAFLPAVIAARLTGWRWSPLPAARESRRSVLSETRSIADYVVGSAYSAH